MLCFLNMNNWFPRFCYFHRIHTGSHIDRPKCKLIISGLVQMKYYKRFKNVNRYIMPNKHALRPSGKVYSLSDNLGNK